MKKMVYEIEGLGKFIDEIPQISKEKIEAELKALMKSFIPEVRQALSESYYAAGLKTISGKLYEATVTNANIVATTTRFVISMAPGVTYAGKTANVYGSAGAKKYGGLKIEGFSRLQGSIRKLAKTNKLVGTEKIASQKEKGFAEFFEPKISDIIQRVHEGILEIFQKYGLA